MRKEGNARLWTRASATAPRAGIFSATSKRWVSPRLQCFSRRHVASTRVRAAVLLTHAHPDHICGASLLQKKYGVPVYMNAADRPTLEHAPAMTRQYGLPCPETDFSTTAVEDGEIIRAAGLEFKVITTPGHSPGGCCYLLEEGKMLFSGDTLFAGTIGRSDLFGGEYDDLIRSIMEKLIFLDPEIVLCPGHGPESTIGQERNTNPFLEPFNEPEEEFDPDLKPVVIN